MSKIKAFSLFSSAGIGELNLHKGNLEFIGANELIEKRAKCYSFFYPNTRMFQGSITDDALKSEMIKFAKQSDVKVLFATPPCQGFSSIGKNKVQKDFVVDRRNFLILEVFDFIDILDLDYILIENVPRFLKMFFPYEGEFLLLSEILEKKYGVRYHIKVEVLNAKYYGISQSRPRAIIKLWKKGLHWNDPVPEKEIPLKDIIGHLPPLSNGEKSNIKWHYVPKIRDAIAESLVHTSTGSSAMKNEIYYPKKENGERISGFHNTYKRMKWEEPAPARTTYSGSVSSHNNVHPGRLMEDGTYSDPRVLSLLETFLVSTISPDIEFPEGTSDTFIRTIIGESIPPLMLEKICYPSGGTQFAK